MLVKDYMTIHPLMVQPTMPVIEAQRFMGENNIRHLPIVGKGKRLLGLTTRQTLLVQPATLGSLNIWEITRFLSDLSVGDVMVKAEDVITIEKDATVEEAARIMVEKKIGCLPVLEDSIVVGIITETDLFNIFTEQLGARKAGVRLTLVVDDVKGEMSRLSGQIADVGGNIVRLTTLPAKDAAHQVVTVKVENVPQETLLKSLSGIVVEVLDAREGPGWGEEGFSPYHWTLEG